MITTPDYNPFLEPDDINSLGIILYEIVTGFLPFPHAPFPHTFSEFTPSLTKRVSGGLIERLLLDFVPPIDLNPSMPKEFNDIILKSLQIKEDNGRMVRTNGEYQSLQEMRNELEKFIINAGYKYPIVPTLNKTDAVMWVLKPYVAKTKEGKLRQIINHIINYSPSFSKPTIVPEDRYQSFAKLKEALHSISEFLK